jgi:arylsulfatase A-like enzyme
MDDWLAGVLEALDGRGILDDTLVIVTSDHGENFGEGGLIAHGFSLDQRLIHVPLVMAGPGALASDRVISLAELPRVIADAAGLEQAPWSDEQLPEGVAVAQFDPLGAADHPRVRDFATRFDLDQHGIDRLSASFTSVTDGIRKLVVRNDEQLLYDLAADPGEIAPIEPSPAGASMAAVRDALVHPAVTAAAADDEPVAVGGAPSASEEELAAIERQMKLLGYM